MYDNKLRHTDRQDAGSETVRSVTEDSSLTYSDCLLGTWDSKFIGINCGQKKPEA